MSTPSVDKHNAATQCETCHKTSDFETKSSPARYFCFADLPCPAEPRNVRPYSDRGEAILAQWRKLHP